MLQVVPFCNMSVYLNMITIHIQYRSSIFQFSLNSFYFFTHQVSLQYIEIPIYQLDIWESFLFIVTILHSL